MAKARFKPSTAVLCKVGSGSVGRDIAFTAGTLRKHAKISVGSVNAHIRWLKRHGHIKPMHDAVTGRVTRFYFLTDEGRRMSSKACKRPLPRVGLKRRRRRYR